MLLSVNSTEKAPKQNGLVSHITHMLFFFI